MPHDGKYCHCPDEKCLMSAKSSGTVLTRWSDCSRDAVHKSFTEKKLDYCLRNKPIALLRDSSCGNGFVEPGEECDCGLPNQCNNKCCDANTCKLRENANCGTGKCCDLQTCQPKSTGAICRPAHEECDLPEYCDGKSEYCPNDIFKRDTEPCNYEQAYCFQGSCKTRDDQCNLLWGDNIGSAENCYVVNNVRGDRFGNCGYNWFEKTFTKCEPQDVLCGSLQCHYYNQNLKIGQIFTSIRGRSTLRDGTHCIAKVIDLGFDQMHQGLTPNGAKCVEGKMCFNQKCISVDYLRDTYSYFCPNNCSGNGVCTNLGQCNCNSGFRPPFCDLSGLGGSIDSVPGDDLKGSEYLAIILYIVFLGIVPCCIILSFLTYYRKHIFRNPIGRIDFFRGIKMESYLQQKVPEPIYSNNEVNAKPYLINIRRPSSWLCNEKLLPRFSMRDLLNLKIHTDLAKNKSNDTQAVKEAVVDKNTGSNCIPTDAYVEVETIRAAKGNRNFKRKIIVPNNDESRMNGMKKRDKNEIYENLGFVPDNEFHKHFIYMNK